jgi:hypothetical protein
MFIKCNLLLKIISEVLSKVSRNLYKLFKAVYDILIANKRKSLGIYEKVLLIIYLKKTKVALKLS